MRNSFLKIFVLLFCLVMVFDCQAVAKEKDIWDSQSDMLVTGGYMNAVKVGNKIYYFFLDKTHYTGKNANSSIRCYNVKTGKDKKISVIDKKWTNTEGNVYYYKGYLYYTLGGESKALFRCNVKSGKQEQLVKGDIIQIHNNQIYYYVGYKGTYVMNLDGSKKKCILKDVYASCIINDRIYFDYWYSKNDEIQIDYYISNLKGKNWKKITEKKYKSIYNKCVSFKREEKGVITTLKGKKRIEGNKQFYAKGTNVYYKNIKSGKKVKIYECQLKSRGASSEEIFIDVCQVFDDYLIVKSYYWNSMWERQEVFDLIDKKGNYITTLWSVER